MARGYDRTPGGGSGGGGGGNFASPTGQVELSTYGAVADGRTVQDAVTNGTTTVTSATAAFTSADVGKLVVITGSNDGDAAAGSNFASTIASVTNGTTAVLAAAPSFSITAANLTVGTDNATAINNWLTAASGKRAHARAGLYLSTGAHTVPGGTIVVGDGYDYISVNHPPQRGTAFIFAGSGNPSYFFQLGTDNAQVPGHLNAVIEDLAIDASNLAQSAVLGTAIRNLIRGCMIWRGSTQAIKFANGSSWVNGSVIGQQNLGDCINTVAADTKVVNSILRQPGSGGANIRCTNANDLLVVGNHMWAGASGVVSASYPSNNIILAVTTAGTVMSNFNITGNQLDGVYGHQIVLTSSGGTSCRISEVAIVGNAIYAVSGLPDNTFSVVYADCQTSSNVRGLVIDGNAIRGVESSTNSWAALLTKSAGAGALTQHTVTNNIGMGCKLVWSNTRPEGGRDGNVFTPTGVTATSVRSSNDGTATFSGTGAATTFTVAHGLAAAPTTVILTPGSAAAVGCYATSDATNVTVNFSTAPVSGTNNIIVNWSAVV